MDMSKRQEPGVFDLNCPGESGTGNWVLERKEGAALSKIESAITLAEGRFTSWTSSS